MLFIVVLSEGLRVVSGPLTEEGSNKDGRRQDGYQKLSSSAEHGSIAGRQEEPQLEADGQRELLLCCVEKLLA